MPPNKNINSKKAAGLEKKAANAAAKASLAAAQAEQQEAQSWNIGSNIKQQNKAEAKALKADEAARKKTEKDALLQAEQDGHSSITSHAKKSLVQQQKNKKKNKNDLSLLEDALVKSADQKAKAKKKLEQLKKEKEEQLKLEQERKRQSLSDPASAVDPLLANTQSMLIGSLSLEDNSPNGTGTGSKLNQPLHSNNQTINASGIDSAISSMNTITGQTSEADIHPEKRMKALHKAFEDRLMPEMKIEYPGLRQSQYKEKIFNLWKKSPENPMNWPK